MKFLSLPRFYITMATIFLGWNASAVFRMWIKSDSFSPIDFGANMMFFLIAFLVLTIAQDEKK